MQDKENAPVKRRIDLSNCKLLSTYGRNVADPEETSVQVGEDVKSGFTKTGVLTKTGLLTKIGGLIKIGLIKRR